MHYRVSLVSPGSGQFRTACGETVQASESSVWLAEVDCAACRDTERFKHNDGVVPEAEKSRPQE